ncbi:protein suppressor 2 of zeste [Drosophila virilis]|uniref:protein suppressor 2 of zeste n=1 Tax=Drosophila virilis TaxID=7244 RepID=UPI00017D3870|nr:protein suppressor 2 of zeste [Drosophila virilis]
MHLKTETQLDKLHTERNGSVRELNQFNELLTCRICQGYMIEPTTVDACYHTYCRSCILKHLLRDVYCPQCKSSGGKHISEDNLRSDETLRALIYKLVPGLYQRECKRLAEFREQHQELDADEELLRPQLEQQQEFFTPGEPISLSLEYHPAMLKNCGSSEKPPICYLQCPADLRVVHLKRFLCSKYDIDAENKHVEVEVTYEDEVLPPSFTLMDVGYCYQWKRHAPMAFRYRILLHERETTKNDENNLSKVKQDIELSSAAATATAKSGKSVTFAMDVDVAVDTQRLPLHATSKARNKSAQKLAKSKRLAKREPDDAATAPSNFKSLRSNDMRYSDYGVAATSCTQPSAPLLRVKSEPEPERETELDNLGAVPNLNIVVSIPQSQLSKSAGYGDEGGFELKTANKKSSPPQTALVRNLPKLKIELNSMKAKLTMSKSAEPRLEDTATAQQQQIDLETYAKNIGLKPIEPAAAAAAAYVPSQDVLKYSPNASPMSSSSSSTNGSSGTVDASTCTNASSNCSTSSHRKRKKKHSKEPKDANGKRKKLHAEISSQTDGKMKMKITTTHNHKAHKLDLKRSHSLAGGELVSLNQLKLEEQAPSLATSKEDALNRTLGEESRSINSLMPISYSSSSASNSSSTVAASSAVSSSAAIAAEKLTGSGKELNLPASPPLPPSLFKGCTPATPPATLTPTSAPAAPVKPKLAAPPKPAKPQLVSNHNNRKAPMLLTCATPTANAAPHFAVPQTPQRQAPPLPPHHIQRYQSTPSSIASAANKPHKRSLSLDETQAQLLAKHPRLDYHQQQQQQLQLVKYAARLKPSPACAPPMRVYGPDMAKTSPMPVRCSASLSLSVPQPTATTTPRARNSQVGQQVGQTLHGLSHPYAEITRLSLDLGGSAASLMGPPASPAKQPARRAAAHAVQSPPLSMPAMVKSPPLSVALSGQRGGNGSNMPNAAYRTSPPALINLRSPQHAFAAKANAGAAKVADNAKKTATVAGAVATTAATVAASSNQSKANGNAALDKSKTSLRDFRPPATATGTTAAAAAAATAKDADILDLSAGTGRSSNSNSNSSSKQATTASSNSNKHNKLAPTTSALSCNNNSSSSNSLEAAVNKIKQNFGANSNSNNNSSSSINNNNNNSAAAATAASGDDLQNLHLLSESATAREKISIKSGNIYENKPKNALVRPQNASVRSIPNPSALAFRNQATPTTTAPAAAAAATTTTIAAATTTIAAAITTAIAAAAAAKPLTVKAEEQPKLAAAATLLSPSSNNNNNSSSNNNNNNNTSCTASAAAAATSPRALKKPTTIDQVAANLNIRAEAKAAALAEEAPLVLGGSSSSSNSSNSSNGAATAAKTPELEKAASSAANVAKTDAKAPATATATATATAATATATAAVAATPTTLALPSLAMPSAASAVSSDSMSKPPVQIAATDTLASVASSA